MGHRRPEQGRRQPDRHAGRAQGYHGQPHESPALVRLRGRRRDGGHSATAGPLIEGNEGEAQPPAAVAPDDDRRQGPQPARDPSDGGV